MRMRTRVVRRSRMRETLVARSTMAIGRTTGLTIALLLPLRRQRRPQQQPRLRQQPRLGPSRSPSGICIASLRSSKPKGIMGFWSRRAPAAVLAADATAILMQHQQQNRQPQQQPHKHQTYYNSTHTNYANKSNTTYTCYRHNNMKPNCNQNNSNSSHNNNSR